MKRPYPNATLTQYRPWFYAAAIYNLVWGVVVILWPNLLFELFGIPQPTDTMLWQVVGMFVMVYAPAYWWAGQYPERNYHFIIIGFLGKVFGPIGFIWAFSQNQLPLSFGWIILFNDLIWWPAFMSYLKKIHHLYGTRTMLKAE